MDELEKVRAERIAQLERRAPRAGVSALTAALCIAASLVLLAMEWRDLAYYFSPSEPITLGSEGDYHFDRLQTNRYVQVHGTPTPRGAYSEERGTTYVVVGLKDTPVLVRRAALAGEQWTRGDGRAPAAPPPPDQRPFGVRGRLLAQVEASRYAEAFQQPALFQGVQPKDGQLWMLLESQKPRDDKGVPVILAVLAAFVALNVLLLVRSARLRKPAA